MVKKKISVIAVNWHAKDFADLLIGELISKSKDNACYEVIIVDNSKNFECEYDIGGGKYNIIKPSSNLGHGAGLDEALKQANGEYILVLDIDSHILLKDFDERLIKLMHKNNFKMICADGGQLKPIRPLFMFFKKSDIDEDMSFKAIELGGINFDVGIHFYFKMLMKHGDNSVYKLPWSKTKYKDVLGNEYVLNNISNERVVYHNWYGTRWFGKDGEVAHQEIDGKKYSDFIIKKNNLFKQL